MAVAHDIVERLPRVIWFGIILAVGICLIVFRLWWMQVVQYSTYGESGEKQSLRTIRMPAARGRIFDRNGLILADNRPLYNLVLYLEELQTEKGTKGARKGKRTTLRLIDEKLAKLSTQIRYPITVTTNSIRKHVDELMPLPLLVAENLPEDAVARFLARNDGITAVDVQVGSLRTYPFGSLAAHVLGYVGRTSFPPDEELSQYYYYMPDMIGKEGLEAKFDDQLRGTAGGKSLTVDVAGYKHGEVAMRVAQPGKNIHLTIDARIQQIVEEAMGDHVGAAVVVDPRNGDILAMTSVPSYNPNDFSPRIRAELFAEMIADPNKPFLNRAVSAWEPGSIFKVITLLAGFEDGKVTTATTSDCPGYYQIGNRRFYCWIHNRGGTHGIVDYAKSVKFSCNVFYYEHSLEIGMTDIVAMARQFKLGERSGVPLAAYVYSEDRQGYVLRDVEARGGLPDTERYYKGQIANTSIGQGDVRATPLQMAYVAAALANGGTVWGPRLVTHFESQDESLPRAQRVEPNPPRVRGRVDVSPKHIAMVREAMLHVVEDEGATGRKAHIPGVRLAGKTGTAQYKKKDPDTGEERMGHHVWFMTFGPFDDPRYAMAIMVEEGDSGGTTCAPIAGNIYRKLFELEKAPKDAETLTRRNSETEVPLAN